MEYKQKKEAMQAEQCKKHAFQVELKKGGFKLFEETEWPGFATDFKDYRDFEGAVLVIDKQGFVWQNYNSENEYTVGCLSFVGLWNGEEMVPIEICNDE